jgi:hypothetical protein
LRRGVDAHDRVAGAIDRGQVARLLQYRDRGTMVGS